MPTPPRSGLPETVPFWDAGKHALTRGAHSLPVPLTGHHEQSPMKALQTAALPATPRPQVQSTRVQWGCSRVTGQQQTST